MSFDLEIHYQSEASNKVSYALSQKSITTEISFVGFHNGLLGQNCARKSTDAFITALNSDLQQGITQFGFSSHNELFYFKGVFHKNHV
jgi:hypothetical protein